MSSNKRKRIKLVCSDFGSSFDDDYRSKREVKMHGGKRVKVKYLNAPLNPFEAAKMQAHNKKNCK